MNFMTVSDHVLNGSHHVFKSFHSQYQMLKAHGFELIM